MTYRVTMYCPDRHMVYDGRTPREVGVGGGITARVRMAHALQRGGHRVTMVVNCPRPERFDGVDYVPLGEAERLAGDILVLTTSGDGLDFSPAAELPRQARLTIGWVHGPHEPGGFGRFAWDSVYAVSNFIAGVVRERWGVPGERIFVSYNAYEESLFERAEASHQHRAPHRLVYFSHPSKGLETALAVLERLRARDRRFHLRVFGGMALWGGAGGIGTLPDGASFAGLTGQAALAADLLQGGFSLQMQAREEPGALAIMEALRGGCVVVASPIGCYPEMIVDGENGLMIEGDHADGAVRDEAAWRILKLVKDIEATERIRRDAMAAPWSSDRMAEAWTGHWDWLLHTATDLWRISTEACPRCGGEQLLLADGAHCLKCSHYRALAIGEPAPVEGTA